MFKTMKDNKPAAVPLADNQLFSLGMVVAFGAAGSMDGDPVFDDIRGFLVKSNSLLDQLPLFFRKIADVSAEAHSA